MICVSSLTIFGVVNTFLLNEDVVCEIIENVADGVKSTSILLFFIPIKL